MALMPDEAPKTNHYFSIEMGKLKASGAGFGIVAVVAVAVVAVVCLLAVAN